MTTNEIIEKLKNLKIENSEDYEKLEIIDELTNFLRQNSDGYLACEVMINLLERHPEVEFGSPGEPVHTLEKFEGHYEEFLMKSLDKHPTQMTVWMLNRMINGQEESEQKKLIQKLKDCITHPLADQATIEFAKDFYEYQTEE
ncbi:hypothetical protein ACFPVY_17395 [Flavobacterium qiangtangense]|uniref:Immunity protein 30 domain-containing protein n=1 Tax=Flavobacterium qiangtangense TaxID=1442595 RepID=A0ABW1PTV0_9FLAO